MITEFMKLNSRDDAKLWASSMLDGADYGDAEIERLANFLWNNFTGQDYSDVRPFLDDENKFWDIVRGTK